MAEEQDVFTSIAQKSNEPSKTIGSKEVISQDDLPPLPVINAGLRIPPAICSFLNNLNLTDCG